MGRKAITIYFNLDNFCIRVPVSNAKYAGFIRGGHTSIKLYDKSSMLQVQMTKDSNIINSMMNTDTSNPLFKKEKCPSIMRREVERGSGYQCPINIPHDKDIQAIECFIDNPIMNGQYEFYIRKYGCLDWYRLTLNIEAVLEQFKNQDKIEMYVV